jgi:DNA-binding NtrC family response regulator
MTPHTNMTAPTMSDPGPNHTDTHTPAAIDGDWPTLDELSLRYLHRVIEHARGNKTKAAEMLGIDRRTVSRILTKVSKQGKTPTMQTANRK